MDTFGCRLISQLVGTSKFKSRFQTPYCDDDGGENSNTNNTHNIHTSHTSHNIHHNNVVQFYWRTKCFQKVHDTKTKEDDDGPHHDARHVYFVDVTVEFTFESVNATKVNNNNKDDNNHNITITHHHQQQQQQYQIRPKVNTQFGALIQRRSSYNTPHNYDGSGGSGYGGSGEYIQTNIMNKQQMQQYANDIRIDLDDTGPIEMANILAKALLSFHHQQERSLLKTTMKNDQIKIHHLDLMEDGYIHFGNNNNKTTTSATSNPKDGIIGKMALAMLLNNLKCADDNDNDTVAGHNNDDENNTIVYNNSNDPVTILEKWWNHQVQRLLKRVVQEKEKEKRKGANAAIDSVTDTTTTTSSLPNQNNQDNNSMVEPQHQEESSGKKTVQRTIIANTTTTKSTKKAVAGTKRKIKNAMVCTSIRKKRKKGKMIIKKK